MIRRILACLVILSSAPAAFAGPIQDGITQDGITQAARAPVQAHGWGHFDGHAMIVSGGAMIGAGATLVVLANTSMKDETVICSAEAVLSCGYGSGPKKGVFLWGLRRAGAGVALTIFGANISIQRGGFRVSKSVTF